MAGAAPHCVAAIFNVCPNRVVCDDRIYQNLPRDYPGLDLASQHWLPNGLLEETSFALRNLLSTANPSENMSKFGVMIMGPAGAGKVCFNLEMILKREIMA